jgi:hypothetical protein
MDCSCDASTHIIDMFGSSPVDDMGRELSPPPPPNIPPEVSVEEEVAFGSPNEGWLLSV